VIIFLFSLGIAISFGPLYFVSLALPGFLGGWQLRPARTLINNRQIWSVYLLMSRPSNAMQWNGNGPPLLPVVFPFFFWPLRTPLYPSIEALAVVYNRISHPVGIAAFALFSPNTQIPFSFYTFFLLFLTANIFYGVNIFWSFLWRGGK